MSNDVNKVLQRLNTRPATVLRRWGDYVEGCPTCEAIEKSGGFGPYHNASKYCESGKYNHCTCDTCF